MENREAKWYIEGNMLLEHRLPGRSSGDKVRLQLLRDYNQEANRPLATMWEWMKRLRCWAEC